MTPSSCAAILKVESVNTNPDGSPRVLLGFAVSAKRYVLYERRGEDLRIVDPKAHGLGFLYPPTAHGHPEKSDWT